MVVNPSRSLSVVVTAYNRRMYLAEAIRSVQAQSALKTRRVDVVVSKNFEDPEVDGAVRLAGFRTVQCDRVTAGEQISQALDRTGGELVALLDDDDRWDSRKLDFCISRFENLPGLGYLGHGMRPIDERGQESLGSLASSRRFYKSLDDRRALSFNPLTLSGRAINELFRINPGCNSSIVVPRDLYDEFRHYLRRIRTSVDHFLLTAALLRPSEVRVEHVALTDWRIHNSNTSKMRTASLPEFSADVRETSERLASDNRVLVEMAKSVGNPEVEQYLEDKVNALSRLRSIAEGLPDRRSCLRDLETGTKRLSKPADLNYWTRANIISSGLQSVSPRLAQTLLYLYLQNETKR